MTKQQEYNRNDLTPKEIVAFLDKYIIGQTDAKRAVAIAFRNRWRRLQVVDEFIRYEITPKNILMKGPTGCGKTEIARRLAKLAKSPFIKVEATKFTQVGYVGRDVDTIIRDLLEASLKIVEKEAIEKIKKEAQQKAINKVVSLLRPVDDAERKKLQVRIEAGEMDDEEVEMKMKSGPRRGIKIGMETSGSDILSGDFQKSLEEIVTSMERKNRKPENQKVKISAALEHFEHEHIDTTINKDELISDAINLAEESGIVFIDEIDKITGNDLVDRTDISRQGVQRDLLPLIEGTTVNTKFGQVKTDHILFVASGAFHYSSPSDLIPEMQGRLPIKVDLDSLTVADFISILSDTQNSLTKQYEALLKTEGLSISFKKDSIKRIAELAFQLNNQQENIGARRLHAIMEKVVEKVSFVADELIGKSHVFSKKEVDDAISAISDEEASSRMFI